MRIDDRDPQKASRILEMGMIYNETLKENSRCLKSPNQVHVALFSLPEQTPPFSLFSKTLKKSMTSKSVCPISYPYLPQSSLYPPKSFISFLDPDFC